MVSPTTSSAKPSSGYFLIRSKLNGLVLDVAGYNSEANTHLVVYPVKGTYGEANQQWKITENGLIKSRLNGFAIDIPGSSTEPFTPVIVYPVNETEAPPNQQWTITEEGLIKSKLNGFVLDILGSSTEALTPVVTYPINGTNGTPNQQWELVPIPVEALAEPLVAQGPIGGEIDATKFEIQPNKEAPSSRIKTVRLHTGWAIDKIQVQYENLATNPPQTYESIAGGGPGGSYGEFTIPPGDYLTKVEGTWGKQAPDYPKENIVTLLFKTYKGVKSQIWGGYNSKKEVEPFAFEAPQGYEIVGFFGSYGGAYNVLVRLGVYLRPVE